MILNEETTFYKVCFDSMQAGIIVFDDKMNIVLANQPVSEIFEYKKSVVGKNLRLLLKNDTLLTEFLENPTTDTFKTTKEIIGIKNNGEEIYLEVSFGKLEYENKFYYKLLLTDINERKKKEKEINALNVQLEEEVKLSNKELQKVIEQLKISLNKEKELNILKTKFIALASHEFKTPLSAILSSTELMAKYTELENVEKQREHLQKVKIMIARLNGMLDNLLTLENIEAGEVKPTYKLVDFKNLMEEVLHNTKPLLKKDQVLSIENTSTEKFYQDPRIIKIILNNILNNAIKYSENESQITVSLKSNKQNLYMSIKDNGIGIPLNEQNLIFNRFFRAKNALYYPGTGIGLNIVKGYVDSLKGTVSFKSTENNGTVFNVQLPKINSHEKKGTVN